MEQKGSLPPIIEDEIDDSLLPQLYRKELTKHSPNNSAGHITANNADTNSHMTTNDSDIINSSTLPYNSWKSRFGLKKSISTNNALEMQSNLGQRLESCQTDLPSHNKDSQSNSHFYSQHLSPVEYRSMDPSFFERSGLKPTSNFNEQENCQPNTKEYAFSYNETPKGYFPDYSRKPFHECINNSENQVRNFSSSYISPDHFKYAPERSHNSVGPHPPYGKMVHTSFPSQHNSSNGFINMSYRGADRPQNFQENCCSNVHPMPGRQAINQHADYYSNYSSKIVNPPSAPPSCNCHIKSEKLEKKRDKSDQMRKKQISDLYRIVWLQNEQIIQVQNQLKKLMQLNNERNDERAKRSHDNEHLSKMSHKNTSEKRMFNLSVIEENQNLMEKVSVGIMTSFIDTTKVKKRKKIKEGRKKNHRTSKPSSSSSYSESTSQDSTDEEELPQHIKKLSSQNFRKKEVRPCDDSIALNGIEIPIVADHISPNLSPLQIEMQEFDSSSQSDESETSESEEDGPAPVGWTFYDKVVGKVNNMLHDSESEIELENVQKKIADPFKKLGISMDQDSPKRVTFDSPCLQRAMLPESDTSMKMNALALKYFKEDKSSTDEDKYNALEVQQTNVPNNTNLSYATLRYLERYHLSKLATQSPKNVEKEKKSRKKKKDKIRQEDNHEDKKISKRKSKSGQYSSGKILDITAIKKQPKLLPKKQ